MSRNALKISKHIPSSLQASLDFSGATAISLSHEIPLERHFFKTLIVLIAALACAYLYFVCASVLNVIARKEAMTNIVQMQSTISVKEQEYFKLSQTVTPSLGEHLGLAPVESPEYINRPSDRMAVRISANEI